MNWVQLLDQKLKSVHQDLAALLATEPDLVRKLAHLTSVPGIGLTTAIVVVVETSGFVLMENERQLTSYAGLDGMQRQSGLSAGATRISRRSNVGLRTTHFLPAVRSLRFSPQKMYFFRPATGAPAQRKPVQASSRSCVNYCCSATHSGRTIASMTHISIRPVAWKKE